MKTFSRPGELGWKPAPSSSSAATRPRVTISPRRRLQDAGDALEQRRLAAAVVTEDADGGALLDVEVESPAP